MIYEENINMDWHEAALAFPMLEVSDLSRLTLPKDDQEYVLSQFNRAVSNAQGDSADIAMITLKKLLTRFPEWAEAALLYGICLAYDGKFRRAGASFQHAISTGLLTDSLLYAAQTYYREAGASYAEKANARAEMEEETAKKSLVSTFFQSRKTQAAFRDNDSDVRTHMQAPILMKVARAPSKSKIASDRERIDVMMQSNSSNGELPDDDIDISIPKTPAEKMRTAFIIFSTVLTAAILGIIIWYVIIPWFTGLNEARSDTPKLAYLVAELNKQKNDPEVSGILSAYDKEYPTGGTSSPASLSSGTSTASAAPGTEATTATAAPGTETTTATTTQSMETTVTSAT